MQKLEELKHGCMAKAADDELVFVLRAQDVFAPQVVEAWASLFKARHAYYDAGRQNQSPFWDSKQSEDKYWDAMRMADAMRQHPNRKIPD